MDRENVIKGLEICLSGAITRCNGNSKCPYYIFDDKHPRGSCEFNQMLRDALTLLKEQETHKFFVDENGKITPFPVVVRCKDCKKRNISECPLHYGGHTENDTDDDWFCADGERK